MIKTVKVVCVVVVVLLALYGALNIALMIAGAAGWNVAENPFVRKIISTTGKVMRHELNTRSDRQMELDGELLGRRLYPLEKGFLKGQLEAFKADPNKEELRKNIREAAHELSAEFVGPVTEGVTDTSRKVFRDLGSALGEFQKALKDIAPPPEPEPETAPPPGQ